MKKVHPKPDPVMHKDRLTVDIRSCIALILESGICVIVVAVSLQEFTLPVIAIAMCILATRQHALFMLYHDAVHGLIARNRRLNDLIINIFVGIPQLIPIHIYRRFHLSHHATFGTQSDPEYLLLFRWQPWKYNPLPWPRFLLQVLGDLFLINMILTGIALIREERDAHSKLQLPSSQVTMDTLLLITGFCIALGLWVWFYPEIFWRFALLWFGTLLTLTHALQKIRSFAEHGPPDSENPTYSWRPGILGHLILWPYNINFHREHHEHPGVPWHKLSGRFQGVSGRPSSELLGHLLAPSVTR